MIRITRTGQRFYDPDDPTGESLLGEDVDFADVGPTGFDPHNLGGRLSEDDYFDLLADEQDEPEITEQPQTPQQTVEPVQPVIPEGSKPVVYKDPRRMIYAAVKRMEKVEFDYYFLDNETNRRLGRSNAYAGRYLFEPHFTFIPYTGNELVVGYDLQGGGGGQIKAFGLDGIAPNGVRYSGAQFEPRPEVTEGSVAPMSNYT